MWVRMAVGVLVGLVTGHFTQLGYAAWMTAGATAGYLAELWVTRNNRPAVDAPNRDHLPT
ncbi:MAG: hypothetical protein GX161_09185 [Firmicutes bacterium]|jgi:hypothetical protein|nr:hypothetical protein [Bacillota bacterium]